MDAVRNMLLEMLEVFTQQDLVKLTGVTQSDISKIKNKKLKSISLEKGDKIKTFYFAWKQKTPAVQS